MGDWDTAILMCVRDIGKEAMLQQIYRKIGNYIQLSNKHLEGTQYGGRPAFQHEVRSFISNLCDSGYLVRLDRGVYSITEKGLKRINIDLNLEDLDV
ncbi:MAG: winged helix-turn-helix domain-containing protein [Pseudomonadota bacterium]